MSMRYIRRPLRSRVQTTDEMERIIERYYGDMERFGFGKPLSRLNPYQVFDVVRRIPYRRDMHGTEIIGRPQHILKNAALGMDCKKKTILISSYARKNGIPYRFACISKKPSQRIHHIFPQLYLNGKWINFDATYSYYKPGQPKQVTRVEYA